MKITIVAGARPNFMKIAPIINEIEKQQQHGVDISYRLVHTGQHYDKNLSETFFKELDIPDPHINLEVYSGTQSEQTGAIMTGFENELINNPTDLVLVVGDVTSTMACTIVAKKNHVKVAHVEAGIRSGDLKMPEEINRIVTDSITDYFFTTSETATDYLIHIGKPSKNIFFVGNVMIDTLLNNLSRIKKPDFWDSLGLVEKEYFVLTLHRPSNVDQAKVLSKLLNHIVFNSNGSPIIFPVHPRTQKILEQANLSFENVHFVSPQGYLNFIFLIKNAKAILTDSGGITEEASVLNVPCITLRDSTERPETVERGTNMLVGENPIKINESFNILNSRDWKQGKAIPKWDGKTASRIIENIIRIYDL